MIILNLIVISTLLLFSSISAARETAFTASSVGKMQKLKTTDYRAEIILNLIKIKERVISSLLITNTVVNIISTTLVTTLFLKIFGDQGAIYASIIMSIMIVFFGEVLPKSLAVLRPETIALLFARLLKVIVTILLPINVTLHMIVNLIIKIFKLENTNIISVSEEVKGILDYQHEAGNVIKTDRDMLGGVLDLKDIEVKAIMIHRNEICMINADLTLQEITNLAVNTPYSRIPLWKNDKDNVIGILHIKNLLKELQRNHFNFDLAKRENFIIEPWFVSEHLLINEQLHAFRQKRNHFALVVNEYGELQGLVTLEDILEEIVGNIEDEHDINNSKIIEKQHSYILDGSLNIRDLNRQLGWSLPDNNANTIAGLIIHETHKIPDQGETLELFGFKVTILKKEGSKILTVKFKKLNTLDDQDDS
jgi:Mg2+/Co2+ transporter CorB